MIKRKMTRASKYIRVSAVIIWILQFFSLFYRSNLTIILGENGYNIMLFSSYIIVFVGYLIIWKLEYKINK